MVEFGRICVLLTVALIVLRKFDPGFPELTIRMPRNRPVESPTGEAKVPVETEPMTVMVPEHVEVAVFHDPLTQASKVSDGSFVLPLVLAMVVTVNDWPTRSTVPTLTSSTNAKGVPLFTDQSIASAPLVVVAPTGLATTDHTAEVAVTPRAVRAELPAEATNGTDSTTRMLARKATTRLFAGLMFLTMVDLPSGLLADSTMLATPRGAGRGTCTLRGDDPGCVR